MKKKIGSLLLTMMILLVSMTQYSFADEVKKSGKVIFINMNRTSLDNMQNIYTLKNELSQRGYVGLMNVRGDGGTDDRRSIASMGSGARVNVSSELNINFEEANANNLKVFEAATGQKAKSINNTTINKSINENIASGQYGSIPGLLGSTLAKNGINTALLGNSDTIENGEVVKNRNLGLLAMDEFGRVESGNIDNINIKDLTMPFGIRTDYTKLIKETKEYYKTNDVLFVDLGDTYRLDNYKDNLNEESFKKMKKSTYKNINNYLKEVFNMVGENDVVYIASAFPSNLDYKNKRRLSPIIKFEGNKKGLLSSATTRRDGIVANTDIGVDILNNFNLKSELMTGRSYTLVEKENNVDFLSSEYKKIVSISDMRSNIINGYATTLAIVLVISILMIIFNKKLSKKESLFKILKEVLKIGMTMPLAFLLGPVFNFKTESTIYLSIFIATIVPYALAKLIFKKDDLKQIGFIAGLTILLIVADSLIGTFLMKNSILSYDAIVGARYYGVGNEYEGVTVTSAVFALAILLNYKKVPKWITIIFSLIILITSAAPNMGANVGGAISESVAYLLFILLIYDIKLDIKKIFMLGVAAVLVVVVFAVLDMFTGSESHLSLFVDKILVNGPGEIFTTFARKIQMNMKLAQTSVWVKVLIAGTVTVLGITVKYTQYFKQMVIKYPYIVRGFVASFIGSLIALLVNDSGIVAAATGSIYIIIPIIIICIDRIMLSNE